MQNFLLRFPQFDKELSVSGKVLLLDVLKQLGILIYAQCGGHGTCGKCKVKVSGEVSSITTEEKKYLSQEELDQNIRLACKTSIIGGAIVTLIEKEAINDAKERMGINKVYRYDSSILKKVVAPKIPTLENSYSLIESFLDSHSDKYSVNLNVSRLAGNYSELPDKATLTFRDDELIDIETGDTLCHKYGIAVDLGTTTIACYLMDLNNGRQLDVISVHNPQVSYGADLISRIKYSFDNKEGLLRLSSITKKAIDNSIAKLCSKHNIEPRHVYECLIVGNTAMNHLFFAISPESLSKLPFTPVTKKIIIQKAEETGMKNINQNGSVIFLQNIGGFVGSDTLGCMIAAEIFNNTAGNKLIIDLGTNGEIVLLTQKKVYVCSTAAGPAFEGAKIKDGMQAFNGAISSAWFEDDIKYTTINNKLPKGICGSGLVDIISVLLENGVITESGEIVDVDKITSENLRKRIIRTTNGREILIAGKEDTAAEKKDISITQKDVREIQLAKGAIRAGINILLKFVGIEYQKVDRLLLTGAFGNFINKYNAFKIGLLPHSVPEKIISVGNAAGEGAKIALCDKNIILKLDEYLKRTEHIEISAHHDFQDEFIEGMFFK